MTYDRAKPYNDLPTLPPPVEVETKAILKRAVSASRALGELKGLGQTIPNQAMLVDSLVLQEAKASSEIENIITTSDALFRAFTSDSGQVDAATKEVLRYREAIWAGHSALRSRPVYIHESVRHSRPNDQGQRWRRPPNPRDRKSPT